MKNKYENIKMLDLEDKVDDIVEIYINRLYNTDKTVVIGHFGTDHLRNKYGLKNDDKEDFSILKRNDNRVIAIDATTAYSKKVNVLVIESEELLDE